MPHVNSVSINIIVKVGSRYETVDEAGISHFLEHMAFKGTSNRDALQIAKEFDAIGGHFNAYTSREQTVYYTKVLSTHTKQALGILADILQNSLFDEKDINKELGVITQEIASVKDNPDDLAYEKFYDLAYDNHPLGRSILGTVDNIAKFGKADFQKYMSKHYTTDNIFISMAGNITHAGAEQLAEELFSDFPKSQPANYDASKYTGGFELTEKTLEQTTIAMGFEGVSYKDLKSFYNLQILSIILGGGLSSRLFQKIREELGLAYGVGSWVSAFSDTGLMSIYAAADHDNVISVIDNIVNEIHKIKLDISEEELERAKAQIESNIYMAEEKPEYKSEEIGKNFALFGRYFPAKEVMDVVLETTIEDLTKTAQKVFSSKPTLSIVGAPLKEFDFNSLCSKLLK